MKLELEIELKNTGDVVRLAGMALLAAAFVQELRKPASMRTWHGAVADVVPYDFRAPTLERVRDAYWSPNNPDLFTPMAFGVGWGINVPTLIRNAGKMAQGGVEEVRQRLASRF